MQKVRRGNQFLITIFLILFVSVIAQGQTTAFTYQGQLSNNSLPANGNFDLQFALFDLSQNGSQQGSTISMPNVAVANGIFTVQLDFGSNVFAGNAAKFMEIGVRAGGTSSAFTILAPRVPITPTPYAIRTISAASADTATTATTATNATQLGGVAASQYVVTTDTRLSDARTPAPGSTNYIQNGTSQQTGSNFNISGNGTVGGVMTATQYNIGFGPVLASPGNGNTFVGSGAGASTPIASGFNTMVGTFAGNATTTGNRNSYFGFSAGSSNAAGSSNSMFGTDAGQLSTAGSSNSFFGDSSGAFNKGDSNSFYGTNSGQSNSTASFNTFLGFNSGVVTTTGGFNTFVGSNAGAANTTAINNAFFGQGAGLKNNTGHDNTFLGNGAGLNTTTGNNDVMIGSLTGSTNTTGSNNTFVGVGAGPSTGGLVQATAIGANAQVSADNTIVLGTSSETTSIPGKLAVLTFGTAGGNAVCRNASNQLALCSSSLRYKTDLTPYTKGLDIIGHLRPISFTWKDGGMRDLGFGAEDVAKIEPLLVTYNQQGQVEGLKYDRITAILVNAVKEQQSEILEQRQQIDLLKKLVCADHPGAEVCK